MSQSFVQFSAIDQHGQLRTRLRELGLLLVMCSESGELIESAQLSNDWFCDLFIRSPLFRQSLRQACKHREEHPDTRVYEAMPGLWLTLIPLIRRRRRIGFSAAVILTVEFLQTEQFLALCQSAQQDAAAMRVMLADLDPHSGGDVHRIAELVSLAHEDQERIVAEQQAIEDVGRQLGESYEEISLLYTIIQSMTVVQQPSRFVTIACEELLGTLPYAWVGALMAENPQRLKKLSGRLTIAGEPEHATASLHELLKRILTSANLDEPIVIDPSIHGGQEHLRPLGRNALVHPVCSDGQVIGILVAGDKQGPDPAASSVDMKLLGATASHMAIFLENAALYDDLNAMFIGTLEALTASIDAKDRYTCGHSQRVAQLTQQLAMVVGLDDQTVRRVRIAGLVHDVGKIGVPESVLTKPGRLTPEEFEEIKKHPEIGHRILKDIPQLVDILPGVLYHHERWDGDGYPHGLKGEAIPRIARLITLADAFDAMSSSRTYRAPMSRSEVLHEIEECAAQQFDPDLARVFIGMDFSEFDRLIAEHKAAEREGQEIRSDAA